MPQNKTINIPNIDIDFSSSNLDSSIEESLNDLVNDEFMKKQYTSKVRTLKDMTEDEIKKLEKTYNCKIRRK